MLYHSILNLVLISLLKFRESKVTYVQSEGDLRSFRAPYLLVTEHVVNNGSLFLRGDAIRLLNLVVSFHELETVAIR